MNENLVPEDELVMIGNITADEPTLHITSYDDRAGAMKTACGNQVSFRVKSPLIPWKHAKLFAVACPGCERETRAAAA